MDLNTFKSRYSAKQRDLLSSIENDTNALKVSEEFRVQFSALSEYEKNDQFFDYVLLVTALQRGKKSITNFLLHNDCRVNIPVETGIFHTPLCYAVRFKLKSEDLRDIMYELIQRGASIHKKDKSKYSALEIAIQGPRRYQIDMILNNLGILYETKDLDPSCETDVSLFHMACWRSKWYTVAKFLEHGFSVNSLSTFRNEHWEGFTPMHFALDKSRYDVIDALLELAIENEDHLISQYERAATVDLLLKYGADADVRDSKGTTPVHSALHHLLRRYTQFAGNDSVVDLLLSQNSLSSNLTDDRGLSYLHVASFSSLDAVKILVQRGASLDSCTKIDEFNHTYDYDIVPNGYTALHFAVLSNQFEIVGYLLNNGAHPDVGIDSHRKLTPLHVCCMHNIWGRFRKWYAQNDEDARETYREHDRLSRDIIMSMLLNHGASVHVCDSYNFSPLCYLCNFPNFDLKEHKNYVNPDDKEAILDEIGIRQKKAIETLEHWGADINYRTKRGSILDVIVRQCPCTERKELAQIVLEKGVDVNSVCFSNYTILHKAVENFKYCREDDGLIDLLLEYGADVNAKLDNDSSPLHLLWPGRDSERDYRHEDYYDPDYFLPVLVTLLNHPDIDINAKNNSNTYPTLLHMAVYNEKYGHIKILLDSGADINVENDDGESPLSQLTFLMDRHDYLFQEEDRLHFAAHLIKVMVTMSSAKERVRNCIHQLANSRSWLDAQVFENLKVRVEKEVESLKRRKIAPHTSLYDVLSKDCSAMMNHSRNRDLVTIISSSNLKTEFPVFSCDLERQFNRGLTRGSIFEDAKHALNRITKMNWPSLCSANILSHLQNYELRVLIKFVQSDKLET
ncbi:hypothetical protein QAD02_006015 [Eretmocerus hayati]|uniref:Uncharacterized protein n=1 Tax=Eretmocerus hayati TaxID=131215 RepID=A0ACC2N0T9_9HYME|nr:hypothetical protein QAD02_006015 [Eretmocerus hayati]